MIMNPTVSIIVPIYNAEKYINRCVDSILNQEYTDYELLLVNDGSQDASGDICDDYASTAATLQSHKPEGLTFSFLTATTGLLRMQQNYWSVQPKNINAIWSFPTFIVS